MFQDLMHDLRSPDRAHRPRQCGRPALWLIIALPLLGAFISRRLRQDRSGRANVHLVACCSVLGAFLLSLLVFWTTNDIAACAPSALRLADRTTRWARDYGTWFAAGGFRVNLGLTADHLSGTMLLVITGVGFLIHLYSTEYMAHDDGVLALLRVPEPLRRR